jgi:hypothetical protein
VFATQHPNGSVMLAGVHSLCRAPASPIFAGVDTLGTHRDG